MVTKDNQPRLRDDADVADVLREPREGRLDHAVGDLGGEAHDLALVDMLDVDAEDLEPLRGVGRGRVHAHGAAADEPEGLPAQACDGAGRAHERTHRAVDGVVGDVAVGARIGCASLGEPTGRGQHPDEAGVLRVDVAEEEQRAGREARGEGG